jgi:hypothetical protein
MKACSFRHNDKIRRRSIDCRRGHCRESSAGIIRPSWTSNRNVPPVAVSIRLERNHRRAYCWQMDAIEDNTPRGWLDSLARGKAEIEAGKTVPLESFLARFRAGIARMEMRQHGPDPTEGA